MLIMERKECMVSDTKIMVQALFTFSCIIFNETHIANDHTSYFVLLPTGAISWGIANIFFGPAIDKWGFKTIYATTSLSFIGCYLTFYLYAKSNNLPSDACRSNAGNAYNGITRAGYTIIKDIDGSTTAAVEMAFANCASAGDSNNCAGENYSVEMAVDEINTKDDDYNHDNSTEHSTNQETAQQRITFPHLLRILFQQKSPLLNISYTIALFTLYIGMSVVESLIFIYFEFLGGSNTMCGLTVAVTVLFELPIFHYAPNILAAIGPFWMFQWGCAAYVIRVVGYSLIPKSHPYWVLLLEPLHGVTIGFVKTGSVAFANEWVPKGYEASGQGFLALIMGLGQFVGLCTGMVLEGRLLYRVLAVVVSIGSLTLAGGYFLTAITKNATKMRTRTTI